MEELEPPSDAASRALMDASAWPDDGDMADDAQLGGAGLGGEMAGALGGWDGDAGAGEGELADVGEARWQGQRGHRYGGAAGGGPADERSEQAYGNGARARGSDASPVRASVESFVGSADALHLASPTDPMKQAELNWGRRDPNGVPPPKEYARAAVAPATVRRRLANPAMDARIKEQVERRKKMHDQFMLRRYGVLPNGEAPQPQHPPPPPSPPPMPDHRAPLGQPSRNIDPLYGRKSAFDGVRAPAGRPLAHEPGEVPRLQQPAPSCR